MCLETPDIVVAWWPYGCARSTQILALPGGVSDEETKPMPNEQKDDNDGMRRDVRKDERERQTEPGLGS